MKKINFSEISPKKLRKIFLVLGAVAGAAFLFFCFEIYVPINPQSHETIEYVARKGWGDEEISSDLKKMGIIRNSWFFKFYVILSFNHSRLQAGDYSLSPKMSVYQIVKKMARGDVIRQNVVILEGWDLQDIGKYLQQKGICNTEEFSLLAERNYSDEFEFMKDAPKNAGVEGYLFPDTYQIAKGQSCQDAIKTMLANFGKKLTPALRTEIKNQKKTIFDIVTMGSMLEKEVRAYKDKQIVSGILWKRISAGMPLQLDSTVNYVTGKSDPSVLIKDTKVNSPYNTYRHKGLPKGPISSPGIDSIKAAIYPQKSPYWFYLTDGSVIYSRTGAEHQANKAIYLR